MNRREAMLGMLGLAFVPILGRDPDPPKAQEWNYDDFISDVKKKFKGPIKLISVKPHCNFRLLPNNVEGTEPLSKCPICDYYKSIGKEPEFICKSDPINKYSPVGVQRINEPSNYIKFLKDFI